MKAKDIRSKSDAECATELTAALREQFNLRMQKATGQMADPSRVRKLRRDIARIHTITHERRMKGIA